MESIFKLLAITSAGVFAGAALYIFLVEHRARIESEPGLAVRAFRASYKTGARFMGSLLVCGFLSATATWLMGSSRWWLINGMALLLLIPYTLIFVFPINQKLLDASVEADLNLASILLRRWGRLHAIRSAIGLVSFFIYILLIIQGAN